MDDFNTLPFSKRILLEKFNKLQVTVGVASLIREGVLHEYPVLSEKNPGALVSQAEHTVIVGDRVTTK